MELQFGGPESETFGGSCKLDEAWDAADGREVETKEVRRRSKSEQTPKWNLQGRRGCRIQHRYHNRDVYKSRRLPTTKRRIECRKPGLMLRLKHEISRCFYQRQGGVDDDEDGLVVRCLAQNEHISCPAWHPCHVTAQPHSLPTSNEKPSKPLRGGPKAEKAADSLNEVLRKQPSNIGAGG
jgi:hypothetical protein